MTDPWRIAGRDLDVIPAPPGNWARIVVLLNIWQDRSEIAKNIDSWLPYVDHVIAADGAYRGMQVPTPHSTDGTIDFLREICGEKLTLIESPADFWPDQCIKQTALYRAGKQGDLLWRIDADERIGNGSVVRQTPDLDVGWATYTAPIYRRTQGIPVLFRWRPGLEIRGRHHWTYDGDRLVCTHQQAGPGYLHRCVPIEFDNRKIGERPRDRQATIKVHRRSIQRGLEQAADPTKPMQGIEPLLILQAGSIDPGLVAYRLHTAINTSGPHCSMLVIKNKDWRDGPSQIPLGKAMTQFREADVLHCHASHGVGSQILQGRHRPPFVMHHHGTTFRKNADGWNRGDGIRNAVLRLVSNLELMQYGDGLQWLPNPVPVARYRQLRGWEPGPLIDWLNKSMPFRIAHSPTKPELKGTDAFLRACERLNAKGLPIQPVIISKVHHVDALRLKATCHATFDSFWLGIQCAGLEGAAMGQPVIAGDPDCRREYEARFGVVPYTFANNEGELVEAIERLATDPAWYANEADRVAAYVLENHDYAAVVERYLDLLDGAIQWRSTGRIGGKMVRAV